MAKVVLASALARWLPQSADTADRERCLEIRGATLAEVLEGVFAAYPNLRGYVLDEHGRVRHHVAVFVDGDAIRGKENLQLPLAANAEIHVMQALSGG